MHFASAFSLFIFNRFSQLLPCALNRFKRRGIGNATLFQPVGLLELGDGAGCPLTEFACADASIVITQILELRLHRDYSFARLHVLVERTLVVEPFGALLAAERTGRHARSLLLAIRLARHGVFAVDMFQMIDGNRLRLAAAAQICSPLPFFAQVGSCVTLTSPQSCPSFARVSVFL